MVASATPSVAPPAAAGRYSDDIVAGAVAGAVARLLSAPFDVLKIRFQLQFTKDNARKYTSMTQAFSTMMKEEGVLSLWKGNLSATYLWITYSMVQFSVYGWLKNIGLQARDPFSGSGISSSGDSNRIGTRGTRKQGEISSMWRTMVLFLAGAGAGLMATSTTYPFDIMRTQFAVQGNSRVFPTMRSFIQKTLETKGVRGFYVGLTPALIGITPYMGFNFALYESFSAMANRLEQQWRDLRAGEGGSGLRLPGPEKMLFSMSKSALCGGVAGGLSKFLVYPLDTIKKRLQIQVLTNTLDGAANVPQFSGVRDLIRQTMRSEGIRGFYKGLGPTTAKAVVSTAVTFAAFEAARDFLRVARGNKEQEKSQKGPGH